MFNSFIFIIFLYLLDLLIFLLVDYIKEEGKFSENSIFFAKI